MISPVPTAPIGSVNHWPFYTSSDFSGHSTSALLCRNTAPLVSFAFQLLARGVACHIVGKDIQVGLEKLIDKPRAKVLNEISALLRRGKRQQAANLRDKVDALEAIGRGAPNGQLKATIAKLFANGNDLTLSTIHKSKGLEWSTVFLLDWHLLPSPYSEAEWEKTQERNLQYVAVTRAKLDLIFLKSGCWK